MKTPIFSRLLLLALLATSCQSREKEKVAQSGKEDTLKSATSSSAIAEADSAAAHESFPSFWQRFRSAVLRSDTGQVVKLTEFPFETRGPEDEDSTMDFRREKFVPVFNDFLKQWSGMDTKGSTELDDIKKTDSLGKGFGKDQARVGDLVFERGAGGWKLTFAYLNQETIDSLK